MALVGRESPRRATYLFFASPKKSRQKKGDPQSGSLRCATGNLCWRAPAGVPCKLAYGSNSTVPDPAATRHPRPSQDGVGSGNRGAGPGTPTLRWALGSLRIATAVAVVFWLFLLVLAERSDG